MKKDHPGRLIRQLRVSADMSRAELAKRAGIGRSTIYRIEETGRCNLITYDKVKRVLLNGRQLV